MFICSMTFALFQLPYPILSELTFGDTYLDIGLAVFHCNLPLSLLLFFRSLLHSNDFLHHYHIPYTVDFSSCIYTSYTYCFDELLLISLITPCTTLLCCCSNGSHTVPSLSLDEEPVKRPI